MSSICIAEGMCDGVEEEMEGLELGKVEEIAGRMDGEVPSMSGSHGNLSDKSHRRIVGRELRVVIRTALARQPCASCKGEERRLQADECGVNISHYCLCVKTSHRNQCGSNPHTMYFNLPLCKSEMRHPH